MCAFPLLLSIVPIFCSGEQAIDQPQAKVPNGPR